MRKGRGARKHAQSARGMMKLEKEIGIAPKMPRHPMHATG